MCTSVTLDYCTNIVLFHPWRNWSHHKRSVLAAFVKWTKCDLELARFMTEYSSCKNVHPWCTTVAACARWPTNNSTSRVSSVPKCYSSWICTMLSWVRRSSNLSESTTTPKKVTTVEGPSTLLNVTRTQLQSKTERMRGKMWELVPVFGGTKNKTSSR